MCVGGGGQSEVGVARVGTTRRGRRHGAGMPAGSLAERHAAGWSAGSSRGLEQGPSRTVLRRKLGKAEKGLEEEPGSATQIALGAPTCPLSLLWPHGADFQVAGSSLWGGSEVLPGGVLGLPPASPPHPSRWTEPSSTTNTPPEPLPPGPRVHAACHLNSPAPGHGLSGKAL